MKLMHFGILGVVSVCKGIQVIPDPKEARAIQELQYEIAQSSLQEQKELDIQDAYINLNWYDYKVDPLNAQYAIGILKTEKGDFRVYFLLKKVDQELLIHQIRIEPDNGK